MTIRTEGNQQPDESQSIQEYYYGFYCSCENPEMEQGDRDEWYCMDCNKPIEPREPDYDEDLMPF
jgi:hypothetical protein